MSTIPNNPRAKELLDAYQLACLADNSERTRLSKIITAYNKANPTEKLKAYHLIQRNFPTVFNYICNKYNLPPEKIFETKFIKVFFNLNILPSIFSRTYNNGVSYHEYSKLSFYMNNREDFFDKAYDGKNITFKDIVSHRLYTYVNKKFISLEDSNVVISAKNLNTLSLFVEV